MVGACQAVLTEPTVQFDKFAESGYATWCLLLRSSSYTWHRSRHEFPKRGSSRSPVRPVVLALIAALSKTSAPQRGRGEQDERSRVPDACLRTATVVETVVN